MEKRNRKRDIEMTKQYNFSNLKVLVVDDCGFMHKVMARLLGVLGIEKIAYAKDGYDALYETRNFHPDIILCDWEMAPMDGPEFVNTLRTHIDTPDPYIPVIMLTGYTEKVKVLAARDFGITEFLAKPVNARALYARLVSIVERPRPYIRTKKFFGPCRRRMNLDHIGNERRITKSALHNLVG